MAYENMVISAIPGQGRDPLSWEYEGSLVAPGVSPWILIPDRTLKVAITLSFSGGGTAKVQTTTNKVITVQTGSPVAVDWDHGTVSTIIQDSCDPCTAIRVEQVGVGVVDYSIVARGL